MTYPLVGFQQASFIIKDVIRDSTTMIPGRVTRIQQDELFIDNTPVEYSDNVDKITVNVPKRLLSLAYGERFINIGIVVGDLSDPIDNVDLVLDRDLALSRPYVSIDKYSVELSETIQVTGERFSENSLVNIYWDEDLVAGNVSTDSSGEFQATITPLSNSENIRLHLITVQDIYTGKFDSEQIYLRF